MFGIICALLEEADAVFPGEGTSTQWRHLPVRTLEAEGQKVAIAVCGLGKVNAALAAALLAEKGAKALAMSGTCGKISAREGDVFWIAEAVQHDYGAEVPGSFVHYNAGAFPLGPASVEPFAAFPDPGIGLPAARMASGDRFIGCPERARFLADGLAADLVDMEVAALAQAAVALGLPWAAIKAPTDDADDASGGDFQANLAAAARRAGEAMERLVAMV